MDWADERYVKFYTRDTPTWRKWSWQGRCFFSMLLRYVDNAGMLDVGTKDPIFSLEVMLMLPREVIEMGLNDTRESQSVELVNGHVIIPKFVEAQEARKTNAASKRGQREKAKALVRREKVLPNVEQNLQAPEVSTQVRQTEADEGRPRLMTADQGRRRPPPSSSSTSSPSSAQGDPTPDPAPKKISKAEQSALNDPRALPLMEKLKEAFLLVIGEEFTPWERDWLALIQLLAMAPPELVLTRWGKSLERNDYPRVRRLSELADYWTHFAGQPTKKKDEAKRPMEPRTFSSNGEVNDF